jgi:hypothetical protein
MSAQIARRSDKYAPLLDEGIYFWRDAGYPMARGRLP